MALLKILIFPDPRLRTKAKSVQNIDESIKELSDDMLETMYEGEGIGLAAKDQHRCLVYRPVRVVLI